MSLPVSNKVKFSDFLKIARNDFSAVKFVKSDSFRWSDEAQTIYYNSAVDNPVWSLLHELGHLRCSHSIYNSDSSLVRMEMEAWASAVNIANSYGVVIDEDHIQDCMDSYRSWQHLRSLCPLCGLNGMEKRDGLYVCMNCRTSWRVGVDRFCRVYRRTAKSKLA